MTPSYLLSISFLAHFAASLTHL